ncbi:M42 family peptidase [Oscillospiraceae bacterium OttesenSCG-928-G22]|nr:M42 family peptidase [Oscillospiraceae bacterium OttesenSCG-928-G22]
MDFDLLLKLTDLDGVSSAEDEVRAFIREFSAPYADDVSEDIMGNLHIHKCGRARPEKKILLAAHMDEVGFIVKSIGDDGGLRVAPIGGVDRRVVIGKRVRVGRDKLPGVLGIKAVHLVTPEERKSVPRWSDLTIDIGASDRASAASRVSVGDIAAFDAAAARFGDGCIKAKALDDRIGCAILLSLLSIELPYDVHFLFSAQEEVGLRGAIPAAYRIAPDIALVVEGTTASDLPGIPEHKRVCKLGGGPALPFLDGGARYDAGLHALLHALGEKYNIPVQNKEHVSGGTDGGAIQRSRVGARVACMSAPVRYIHSPSGVACLNDIEAMRELAYRFIETVGGSSDV